MKTVRSRDGSTIAFDQLGEGPPVILVAGAFSYRRFPQLVQLAELLAQRFTVVNFDRRGRGDSTETKPYAVEREIEDIQALIDAVGGSAYVWGMSSGAVLALRAAEHGLDIKKLALYEPPFRLDPNGPKPPEDFTRHLQELIDADQRAQAVKYFMTKGMGAPGIAVTILRLMPQWSKLKAVAHTLPYDQAVMSDTLDGNAASLKQWASVGVPTLVIGGGKSPAHLRQAVDALAETLPNAQVRILPGENHMRLPAQALTPVLTEFFID
jgi:pimeloyl-ACP methyl ester carboxylesterase